MGDENVSKEYRVITNPDGNLLITDMEGNRLSPDETIRVGEGLSKTARTPIYVYLASRQSTKGEWVEYKIGMTNDPERRGKEILRGYKNPAIRYYFRCDAWGDYSAQRVEKALHVIYKYAGLHITGEWFRLDGRDVALFRKWFGEGKGQRPKEGVLDVILGAAAICLTYQKKSLAHWVHGSIVEYFNIAPEIYNNSYESILATLYGYRRITEAFPRHYTPEVLEAYNQDWQTSIDMLVEKYHDLYMRSPVEQFFDDLNRGIFFGKPIED